MRSNEHTARPHGASATRLRPLLLAAVAAAFFMVSRGAHHYWDEYFYLFSVLNHSPRELVALEPSVGLFPIGFFSAKFGFVALLWTLVHATGPGMVSLLAIQAIFAVLVVALAAAAYGLLREITDESHALRSAIIVLFLPASIYFSYKVMSEIPSLLLVTLGGWAFLRSLRAEHRDRRARTAFLLLLATLGVLLGTLVRVTSALAFAGLLLGVLAGGGRFPRRVVLRRAAIVVGGVVIAMLGGLALLDVPADRFVGLVRSVTQRATIGLPERAYAVALFLQLFAPVLALALWRPKDPRVRVLAVWAAACALPFISGYAPRYYYMTLVPVAALADLGLVRLVARLPGRRAALGWVAALAAIVIVDRVAFAPLMPYEIDQREYRRLMAALPRHRTDAAYLIAWISDYSFLRFAYPDRRVLLATSEASDGDDRTRRHERQTPLRPAAQRWAGEGSYVGSPDALAFVPAPYVYIGWTYNPAVMRMRDHLHWLGIDYLDDPRKRGMQNHLEMSWIWDNPEVELRQIAAEGQYRAFDVFLAKP